MRLANTFRTFVLVSGLFLSTCAYAQSPVEETPSPVEEIARLPTAVSAERLQSLQQLSVDTTPGPGHPHARRRLPRPPQLLTPEELAYKQAVQKLGVNAHRFVHCDLPNGKVRTGVITQIHDNGFVLKDGIFFDQWISYSDLKAAPRPVAAVGTRIGQGFKWAGVVLIVIPLAPFAFLFWDGC